MMEEKGMRILLMMLRALFWLKGRKKYAVHNINMYPAHAMYGDRPTAAEKVKKRGEKLARGNLGNVMEPEATKLSPIEILNNVNQRKTKNDVPRNVCGDEFPNDCPVQAVLVESKFYTEGISFKNMTRIVLSDLPATYTELVQQVGRASRACAMRELGPYEDGKHKLIVDAYLTRITADSIKEHFKLLNECKPQNNVSGGNSKTEKVPNPMRLKGEFNLVKGANCIPKPKMTKKSRNAAIRVQINNFIEQVIPYQRLDNTEKSRVKKPPPHDVLAKFEHFEQKNVGCAEYRRGNLPRHAISPPQQLGGNKEEFPVERKKRDVRKRHV